MGPQRQLCYSVARVQDVQIRRVADQRDVTYGHGCRFANQGRPVLSARSRDPVRPTATGKAELKWTNGADRTAETDRWCLCRSLLPTKADLHGVG